MSLSTEIKNIIQNIPEGKLFGYEDLDISNENIVAAAKVMERLQKYGEVKKLSKGIFYKPKQSILGELQPNYNELIRPYLFENGKRIAYVTGTSLYNQLGLTTQMAFTIKIASRGKRISINRGSLKAIPAKSYAEVTEENYQLLGILDAFKDIKKIPDCSVKNAIKRLSAILKDLTDKQKAQLINYARLYPARVKALVGAILEKLDYCNKDLEVLRNELNPFTKIKLGIKDDLLSTRKNWNIE